MPEATGFDRFIRDRIEESGEQLYTTSDIVKILKRSKDTVIKWRKNNPELAPSREIVYGKTRVYLYTNEDLARLKTYAKSMYRGRRMDLERKL